jgi:hypothetical protein
MEKVKRFVNIMARDEGDYDLKSDAFMVDAKSVMGIFSLDFSKPLLLSIHDDSKYDLIRDNLRDVIVEQL